MSFRQLAARSIATVCVLFTALLAVGLTASPDGPFVVAIKPVLLRVDTTTSGQPRTRALGVDIDVKLGPMHLHAAWSAIPVTPASTNPRPSLF